MRLQSVCQGCLGLFILSASQCLLWYAWHKNCHLPMLVWVRQGPWSPLWTSACSPKYVTARTAIDFFQVFFNSFFQSRFTQSVRLHAQLSRATITVRLGHLIGQLSLSQYASAKREFIYYWTPLRRWWNAPFSWLPLDLLPINQTVSKRLVKSLWNHENVDNFTVL